MITSTPRSAMPAPMSVCAHDAFSLANPFAKMISPQKTRIG